MIVTIVLTRTAGPIGRLYAWDLAGAAFGCLAVVPALDSGWFNLSSLVLLGAAVAAASGYFFSEALPWRQRVLPLLLAIVLAAAAAFNGSRSGGLEVAYTKNRQYWLSENTDRTYWNSHSYVVVQRPGRWEPFLWGGGHLQDHAERVNAAWMVIDGEAGHAHHGVERQPAQHSIGCVMTSRRFRTTCAGVRSRSSGSEAAATSCAAIWGITPRSLASMSTRR